MWMLLLLTFTNAIMRSDWINSEFLRIPLGSFPVNINDWLIVAALLTTLFPKGQHFFETERTHPALIWAIGLFLLALMGAGFGAVTNGATARQISTTARNLVEVPILAYLGYRLIPRPSSAVAMCYILIFAGIGASASIFLAFKGGAEELTTGTDITTVRVIQYVTNYGMIAAAMLLFSIGSGVRPLFRAWIALPLAAFCFLGPFATLSRSDWLAIVASLVTAVAIMPKYRVSSKVFFSILFSLVMGVALMGAIFMASSLTGKDVGAKMMTRLESLLPGDYEGVKVKAWDTRTSGSWEEIKLWVKSPIIGGGFGIQDTHLENELLANGARHNAWTSTLAESGLIGFSAFLIVCVAQIVVGRRMIRDHLDRGTVLIGGLGVITGVQFIIYGYCTMSFNQVRWAIPLALTFGTVMRCRMMQLTVLRQYEGYLPTPSNGATGHGALLDEATPLAPSGF